MYDIKERVEMLKRFMIGDHCGDEDGKDDLVLKLLASR